MLVELPGQLLVEHPGFAFVAKIEYERLPPLCHACKMIGHSFSICKKHNIDKFSTTSQKTGSHNVS